MFFSTSFVKQFSCQDLLKKVTAQKAGKEE
jgi:hypothetical protein